MPEFTTEAVGLIPARGGSKSLPKKNIHPLAGKPLLQYVCDAGRTSRLGRLFCSTDDQQIGAVAEQHGAIYLPRAAELASDDAPVASAILAFLSWLNTREGVLPWAVALLQPTSPFVQAAQIDACLEQLAANPQANSIQTVTQPPHNHHAFNQREIVDGHLHFRFAEERKQAYNKQRKPPLWVFGNLVITRTSALLDSGNVFATPSLAHAIPRAFCTDVDSPADFLYAEWQLVNDLKQDLTIDRTIN